MGTIADLVLVAIAVIALFTGGAKGLIKQLSGAFCVLLALVLATMLTSLIMTPVKTTGVFQNFVGTATNWFTNEMFKAEVTSAEELATILQNGGAWKILSGMAATIYASMEALGCTTLGQLCGNYVASLIVEIVLWIVLFVIVNAVLKFIAKQLQKVAQLPVFKPLDRILGAVWAVGITYVVLIGIVLTLAEIVVMKFAPDSTDAMLEFLKSSKLLSAANDTNVIGSLFADLLNVTLPVLNA